MSPIHGTFLVYIMHCLNIFHWDYYISSENESLLRLYWQNLAISAELTYALFIKDLLKKAR